ncbi:hypothetical protein ACHAWF_012539 [Thalassiosira exigua]
MCDDGWHVWARDGHPLLVEAAANFALVNDSEPAPDDAIDDGARASEILGEDEGGDGGAASSRRAIDSSSGRPLLLAEKLVPSKSPQAADEDRRTAPPSSGVPSLGPTGNEVTTRGSDGAGDGGEDCLLGRYLVASFLPTVAAAREQVSQFRFSFLDDQDDGISVLTSRTFFTTASGAVSEADCSESCEVSEGGSLCDDDLTTVLTPRTANYSCHAHKISRSVSDNHGDEHDAKKSADEYANDSIDFCSGYSCRASKISLRLSSKLPDNGDELSMPKETQHDRFQESIKKSIGESTSESIAFERTHPRGILRSHSRSHSPIRRIARSVSGSSPGMAVTHNGSMGGTSLIRSKSTSNTTANPDQDARNDEPINEKGDGKHVRTSSKNSVSFQYITESIGRTDGVDVVASSSPQRAESNGILRPRLNSDLTPQPPSSRPQDTRDVDEETLHTALAEPLVSAVNCCGSTLTTSDERSLLIRQGRCPTCGIQTHKISSKMFGKRRLRPLTNEHILSGRCLVCNPIDVVMHGVGSSNADDRHESLSAQKDDQSSAVETRATSSDVVDHPAHNPIAPRVAERRDHEAPPPPSPSAPPLDICFGSTTEPSDNSGKKYFSRAESRDEVERWLLSHLPTLQERDVETYCRCLVEDGFDSITMLEVLEEADLHFMRKAHRRYLTKRLSASRRPRAHQE